MVDLSSTMPTMPAIRPPVDPARRLPSRGGTDLGSVRGSDRGSVKGGSIRGSAKAGSAIGSVRGGSVISGRGAGTVRSETDSVVNLRRRTNLRDTLVKKLLDKYHPGIADSKTEALVHTEVDKLIAMGTVSEVELRDSEAKIRRQSNSDISSIATNPFKQIAKYKSGAPNEWAKMNQNMHSKGLTQDALKAMQLQQSKEDFKKELSLQLTLVENRKQVEKMEKLEDAYKIQKDVRQYKDSLEQSKREQVERFQRVREERENEMAQVRERHERVKNDQKDEEKATLTRLRKEQREEIIKDKVKRDEEIKRLARWKNENDTNLKERERVKVEHMRKERAQFDEARRVGEEREKRRDKDMAEMKKKMEARDALALEQGETMAGAAKADEDRMFKEQEKLKAKADADHEAKASKEKRMKREMRESLDKQVQDQQNIKMKEAETKVAQSKVVRREALRAIVETEREALSQKAKVDHYRGELEDQLRMDVKHRPALELRMSSAERRINRELI